MTDTPETKKRASAKPVMPASGAIEEVEDHIDEEPVDRSKFSQSLEEELQEDDEDSGSDELEEQPVVDEEGEEAPQGGFRLKAPVSPRRAQSASELLGEELGNRARNLHDRLRSHLTGTVLVNVTDSKSGGANVERYLFDWTHPEPKSGPTEQQNGDCIITIREPDLLRLAQGHLNPQISMLSDRVGVSGRVELAVYFFNLISPPPR